LFWWGLARRWKTPIPPSFFFLDIRFWGFGRVRNDDPWSGRMERFSGLEDVIAHGALRMDLFTLVPSPLIDSLRALNAPKLSRI
jgi:hypothetical protein